MNDPIVRYKPSDLKALGDSLMREPMTALLGERLLCFADDWEHSGLDELTQLSQDAGLYDASIHEPSKQSVCKCCLENGERTPPICNQPYHHNPLAAGTYCTNAIGNITCQHDAICHSSQPEAV